MNNKKKKKLIFCQISKKRFLVCHRILVVYVCHEMKKFEVAVIEYLSNYLFHHLAWHLMYNTDMNSEKFTGTHIPH